MAAAAAAERLWPLGVRGNFKRNLKLLTAVMAVGWAVGFTMAYWSVFCAQQHIGLLNGLRLSGPMHILLGLLIFDFGDYVRHYAFHKVPQLWRLHRVHHEDAALDCTTAFRTHPGENLAQGVFYCAVIALFGVPLATLLWRTPLVFAALILQHTNVRLPLWLDQGLNLITPSPRQHRVHHSSEPARTDSNFGVLLTLWDRALGTYLYPTKADPLKVGL
jgi:sterol desaturase/sphingolipid hydroxylase (fatty acid hydroxylase superfamily)